MAYELIWEPDGIHKQFSGFVTGREFIESVENVQADPSYDDIRYVINDFSEVNGHEVSEDVLVQLAAINYGAYSSNPNCRIAFVTKDDEFAHRIKKTLMAPDLISYQTEVCPSVPDARDWLDSQPKLQTLSNVMGFIDR